MTPYAVPYRGITHNAKIATLKGEAKFVQSYAEPDATVVVDFNGYPITGERVLNLNPADARVVAHLLLLAADEADAVPR